MADFSRCHVWCCVFLLLLLSHKGKPQVIGPSQPIVAIVGEDIILPCRLEPPRNASGMVLEWGRPDLSPGFVYVRRDSEEYVADKQPSYRGRTSVSVDKLELGDASVKLSQVTRSDEGTYRCLFPQLGQHALIRLVVGVVSTPVIEFVSSKSREVVLQCEAKGWYPEPEVFWLDAEGNLLSAGPTETVRGPDDLYTVSRRLTVEKSDNFTCRVQQKNINQTRETHIYVPAHFFGTSSQLAVLLSIIIIIIIISVGFLGVMLRLLWLKCKPTLGEGGGDWRTSNQHQMWRRQKMRHCFEHGLKPPKVTRNNQEVAEKNISGNLCDTGRSHLTILPLLPPR